VPRLAGVPLAGPVRLVTSVNEIVRNARPTDVVFVDHSTIDVLAKSTILSPVVAISEERVPSAIGWFLQYAAVSHILSVSMLEQPFVERHLAHVYETLTAERPRLLDWLEAGVEGRRIRLTHASRRVARLERMSEYIADHGASARTVERLRDVAEELLTNAFYDAPVAAGVLAKPVPRTYDIALPEDCACDLAYGCSDDIAIVHVRDPFGSLTRRRLLDVLSRCAASGMSVQVDETMGGAGLGMWRIFTQATFVAVSVQNKRHTEILVGINKRGGGARKPFAFHLFFNETSRWRRWFLAKDNNTSIESNLDKSVTLKTESE
jgi:hypothetical protein